MLERIVGIVFPIYAMVAVGGPARLGASSLPQAVSSASAVSRK